MKEWYCLFHGRKEGPFSLSELKKHPRFTPDTLVWKEGFKEWVRAGDVRALDVVFKDEKKGRRKREEERSLPRGTDILTAGRSLPPPFWFLVLLVVFFLLWVLSQWIF